jgi:hypothetical protein
MSESIKCGWCGKTLEEHVDFHEFTDAIPRVPCQLLKANFFSPPIKPKPRTCEYCRYWKKDYGMWCFNGWSKGGPYDKDGSCMVQPTSVFRRGDEMPCALGEKK